MRSPRGTGIERRSHPWWIYRCTRRSRRSIMLVCYLDDSGTGNDLPVVTMAGYIGPTHKWSWFEQQANKIFEAYNVDQLHAVELNGTKGEFKGWSRSRKESFIARLYSELINAAEFGVAFSITKGAYKRARFDLGVAPNEFACGHCFKNVVDAIMRSAVTQSYVAKLGATVSFVLEGGNSMTSDIKRNLNEIRFDPHHVGVWKVFGSISFVDKDHSNQIMAISGHRSLSEAEKYVRAADQVRLAQAAMASVSLTVDKAKS